MSTTVQGTATSLVPRAPLAVEAGTACPLVGSGGPR